MALFVLLTLALFTDPHIIHPAGYSASAYVYLVAIVILPSGILLAGVLFGDWLGALLIFFCGLAWLIAGGIVGTILNMSILLSSDIFPGILTVIGCSITPLVVGTLYKRRQFGGGGQAALILLLGTAILAVTLGILVTFYLNNIDSSLATQDAAYHVGYGIGVVLVFLLLGLIAFLPAFALERIIYAITASRMKARNPQPR